MVKKLIQQKEWILQQSLMNLKTLCSTRKYSDIKWEQFKAKNINLEHIKSKRKSLSCFDDKRSVSNDGIHTWGYFHKKLKKLNKKDWRDSHK